MFYVLEKLTLLPLLTIVTLALMACEPSNASPTDQQIVSAESQVQAVSAGKVLQEPQTVNKDRKILPIEDFISAEWIDLIPEDDLQALFNPPEYLNDIADGSVADQLNNPLHNNDAYFTAEDDSYQRALTSTRVVAEIDNAAIRIPAFIVPLEFDDQQKVTQFFLVPFFGACIHQPPPPPNQTIFGHYPQGFTLESLYEPLWVLGVMKTSTVTNEMATAAYSMDVHHLEVYLEE